MKRTLILMLALASLFGSTVASVAQIETRPFSVASSPDQQPPLHNRSIGIRDHHTSRRVTDSRQPEATQTHVGEQGTWSSSGPRGGKANALAVSPNLINDNLVFTGEWLNNMQGTGSGLGVFKSTNAGQTWVSSSQGLDSSPYPYGNAVHGYAFSPDFANDQTLFVATWAGLFKSINAGANWQFISSLFSGPPGAITTIALAPDYPSSGHMLAGGGYGGVNASEDGVNWTSNYSVTIVSALAYSPNFASDNTAFASGFGIYKTTDRGINWTPTVTASITSLVVSPQFAVDQTIFAGGDAFYKSINGGTNWITSTVAPSVTFITALAISPDFGNDQTLFAGTNEGLYRSNNAGSNWNIVTGTLNLPILSLAISPGWPTHSLLLIGTPRGVYRLVNNTLTASQGMTTLPAGSLTLSADESIWLAASPNHGIYAGTNNGAAWMPFGLQEGSSYYLIRDTAISPNFANDHTLFAAWNSSVSIGGNVRRSTNSGVTWEYVYNTDSVPSLAISPNFANDSTVFAIGNTGRVISLTNGGDDWSQVATWPTPFSPNVWNVAVPPNYASNATIFAAGQGFYRLPPGASTWQLAATGLLTDTSVKAFDIAPNYVQSQTLLAAVAWTVPVSPTFIFEYGVFRSNDGGVNWQLSNIGLPANVELRTVAFSPNFASDRTAYALAIDRFYRSTDRGLHWTAIDAPPGSSSLVDLAVNQAGDVIITSNTGVWRYHALTRDILIDGDFEANNAWDLPSTPQPAAYSTQVVYQGLQSMRIGIDGGANVATFSSARQTVTLPISITAAILGMHVYPVSDETTPGTDSQYALIIEPSSGAISQTLFSILSNAQSWQPHTYDLTQYAGQTIVLHFGVSNDGAGGRTAMYVDDATLLIVGELSNRMYLPIVFKNHP